MGHEIYYCSVCQKQIRWQEVERGQAFKLDDRIFCLACGPDLLKNLPKDRVKEIFTTLAAPAPPHKTPSAPSTSRVLLVAQQAKSRKLLIGIGIAGLALIGVGVWVASSSRQDSNPVAAPAVTRAAAEQTAPPAPRAAPPSPPPVAAPTPIPPPAIDTKEQAARSALQKARDFEAAHPSDFDQSIRDYQEACFVATGTSLQGDAKKELEQLRKKQREFFQGELSSIEADVVPALKDERFMKAIELLRIARDRHSSTEWKLLVGKRTREVSDTAFQRLNAVKEEALDAKGRGDRAKVDALRARVASWGVPELIKEFRETVDE
jgi:hypothetical protein